MGYNHYSKQSLVSLGILYPSAFFVYFAILGRIDGFYDLPFSLEIRITGLEILFLCAISKCAMLYFGAKYNQMRCMKLSQLIGMFELTAMVIVTSLFWMYEYLHNQSLKYLVVLPLMCVGNLASHGYFFYSTSKSIIVILSESGNEAIITGQGMLQ